MEEFSQKSTSYGGQAIVVIISLPIGGRSIYDLLPVLPKLEWQLSRYSADSAKNCPEQ